MSSAADLVIFNASVLTMDPDLPRAGWIATSKDRIVALGSGDGYRALVGPRTDVLDAGGASVLPGFIESHMHVFMGAGELDHLQLAGVHGVDALTERLTAYARERPDDTVLMAQGCDYTILGEGRPLTRHDLDRIVADRPVALVAADHHTMWVNTRALERAGLLHGMTVNPGNEVVMGADGLATGELREAEAMNPITRLAGQDRVRLGIETGGEPEPWPTGAAWEADKDIMRRGLAHAAAHGITSIHNMDGNLHQLRLLEEIEREGGLICRVQMPFHFKSPMTLADLDTASTFAARYTGDWLKSGIVKIFMDGVLDSGTAHMLEPYRDQPGWSGEPYFSGTEFAELATEFDRRGLQIAVHAIGDAAVRGVLDGYEAAARANGRRDSRHRVEHIELTTAADIARFVELGVIASMQPTHTPGALDFPLEPTLTKLGRDRWQWAHPCRSIRETGAHVAFSSDWPVTTIDPMRGIQAAVMRKPWAEGLDPQAFTLHEAIAAFTVEGAYAEFAEDRKGVLKVGHLADIVVLSGDIEATAPERLHELLPAWTICGGKVTYENTPSASQ